MSRVEFEVALLCHHQLRLDVESCLRIDLMFEGFHADGAKLFECMGHGKHIILKERNFDGVEMVGRRFLVKILTPW